VRARAGGLSAAAAAVPATRTAEGACVVGVGGGAAVEGGGSRRAGGRRATALPTAPRGVARGADDAGGTRQDARGVTRVVLALEAHTREDV